MLRTLWWIQIIIVGIIYFNRYKKTMRTIHIDLIFLFTYSMITTGYYYIIDKYQMMSRFLIPSLINKTALISFWGFLGYVFIIIVMSQNTKKNRVWDIGNDKELYKIYRIMLTLGYIAFSMHLIRLVSSGTFTLTRGISVHNNNRLNLIISSFSIIIFFSIYLSTQASLILFGKISKLVKILILLRVILSVILGDRSGSIFIILGVLFIYERYTSISYKKLLVMTLLGSLINFVTVTLRGLGTPSQFFSNIKKINLDILDMLIKMPTTFAATKIDTTIFRDYAINTNNLKYGATYIGSLLNVLFPYRIFGFYVSQPMSLFFKSNYYPDIRNHGFDFTLVSESIINFGIFGPLIVMMIISYFLYNISNKTGINDIFLSYKIVVINRLFFTLRSDSNGFFKSLIYYFVFYILILIFLGFRIIKKDDVILFDDKM